MTARPPRESLTYRDCAGAVVFNRDGKVFMGRRNDIDPEGDTGTWQFPQGGIDAGEEAIEAAIRELFEETSIHSVSILTAAPDWIAYDVPDEYLGIAYGGRHRGQRQRWFAFAFEGEDDEIDILSPGGGAHKPEFSDWRWEDIRRAPELVVPFKRPVYETLGDIFAGIPAQLKNA